MGKSRGMSLSEETKKKISDAKRTREPYQCSKCREIKTRDDFHKRRTSWDGLSPTCKACAEEWQKQYREKNKDRAKEYHKQYYLENKDKVNEYLEKNKEYIKQRTRRYYENNKASFAERKKQYMQDNKEKISEYMKHYRVENEEAIKKQREQYFQENREDINARRRANKKKEQEYQRKKRQNNINYRIINQLRCRVYKALRYKSKHTNTMELIGCTIECLKQHLAQQFRPGMSWDNYGGWHVDHIRPCASFDLTDPEQQKECFHYTNLQPLWAEENLRKGVKIDSG